MQILQCNLQLMNMIPKIKYSGKSYFKYSRRLTLDLDLEELFFTFDQNNSK